PLVLAHPVTGRPALYGAASTSRGIRGLEDAEARALLDALAEHASQDRFVHAHRYRPGDIVLWDNFSLMHKATLIDRASGPGTQRYLHRISTKDLPATA
ncbi:MAG: TauD/TfdA family dioxygenase, partial [Alphaproteobacteria bacterium]|nr:TauD/TfdA family dioxygenase [Alphaproteobacteria bacterium]